MDRIFPDSSVCAGVCAEWERNFSVERIQESSFQPGWSMAMPLVHATTRELRSTHAIVQIVTYGIGYATLSRCFHEAALPPLSLTASAAPPKSTLPPLKLGEDKDWGKALKAYGGLPTDMKAAPICFLLTLDETCLWSRGQLETLGHDDDALVGTNMLHTVFLEDQIAIRQMTGEWMQGLSQDSQGTAPSVLRNRPVKRLRKDTGARIQMLSAAAFLNVESTLCGEVPPAVVVVAETPLGLKSLF